MIPSCPAGFDCALLNSCPAFHQPCPDGFLCSSYQGNKLQDDIDFGYAKLFTLYDETAATEATKDDFVVEDRAVQSVCYAGFYCPNATSILPCPEGHWCSERTVEPRECDFLSVCDGTQQAFQVNFVNTTIMVVLTAAVLLISTVLSRRQRAGDVLAHKNDVINRPTEAVQEEQGQAHSAVAESPAGSSGEPAAEPSGLVQVQFKDLSFVTPSGQTVLPGVSGMIPAGQISAVLGPTACGKTTLLNLLRLGGQGATSGEVSVTIDDPTHSTVWDLDRSVIGSYVGYVPQEDVFDRELTVRELLTFCALTRTSSTTADAEAIVNQVLMDLGILHIAESIIGGGENLSANISGGQLKRVNIAVELVALSRPGLLLLDEPTAGLDAAVAFDLMKTLENVCSTGITIVLVLQQPRVEIFSRIQHLFLMNQHGGIVYEGASADAAAYLQSLGYANVGEEASDADFCLDVLNGMIACNPAIASLSPNSLHLHWKQVASSSSTSLTVERDEELGTADQRNHRLLVSQVSSFDSWKKFGNQLVLNAKRLLLVRTRDRSKLLIYIVIDVLEACALSSGFSIFLTGSYLGIFNPSVQQSLQGYFPSVLANHANWNTSGFGFEQLLFFISTTVGTASCLAAVPVFAGQLANASRERDSGISLWAFSLGRIAADTVFVVLNAFVFTGTWCMFGHAGSYYDWIATIVATSFAASAVGYIASAAVRKNSASVLAIVGTFVFCVFAGVQPTLTQVSSLPVVSWPWYLSYATWTAEACYVTWSRYLTNGDRLDIDLQDGAERYGYDVSGGLGRSVGVLICLGVGMRILAAAIFIRKAG